MGTVRVGEGVTALTLGEAEVEIELNKVVEEGVPVSVLPFGKGEGEPPDGEMEAKWDTEGLGDVEPEMAGVEDVLADREAREDVEGEPEELSLPKPTEGVVEEDVIGVILAVEEKKGDTVAIDDKVEQLVPIAVAEGELSEVSVGLKDTEEDEELESLPASDLPKAFPIVPVEYIVKVKDPAPLSDTVEVGVDVEEKDGTLL